MLKRYACHVVAAFAPVFWAGCVFVVIACGSAGCLGNDMEPHMKQEIYYQGTDEYYEKIKVFELNEMDALGRMAGVRSTAVLTIAYGAARVRPTYVLGECYVFPVETKMGPSLNGYYVNGKTGEVEWKSGFPGFVPSRRRMKKPRLKGEIKRLSSALPLERLRAADALGRMRGRAEPAIPYLIAILRDDRIVEVAGIRVAVAAADALSEIGEPAVQPLLVALKDKSPCARKHAAQALGRIQHIRSIVSLIAAIRDKDARVREAAAFALRFAKDRRALQALIAALKDKEAGVRAAAASAIGVMKSTATVEALLRAFRDESPKVRTAAVEALIGASRDESPKVRAAAIGALGRMKSRRAVQPLLAALKDENTYVCRRAIWALGRIGDNRAVEPLTVALHGEAAEVRASAANALGSIGDRGAIESLLVALKDEDAYVRTKVARALGRIGDNRAVEALTGALNDKDARVREAAENALRLIKAEIPLNLLRHTGR